MNSKIEYGLEGAFKVDIYSGRNFVSTTDYFTNFITPTGLLYPLYYAFADCFRYLSIGRSAINHSGTKNLGDFGTTGLYDPISSYSCSDGTTQKGTYINWEAYSTGEENSNCGTVITEAGPRFYRAWNLPSGNPELTINEAGGSLTISEFMVSPSSGIDPTGKYAFSRVVRNLTIPNGHRAIVSYQLKINVKNTGVTQFAKGSFSTGNAEVSTDLDIVKGWANLSGYYRQVYHGLRCVDNLGITYIPKLGDGMEPSSKNIAKMIWYLSPDNSHFDVNTTGGHQTSVAKAYSADGLMAFVKYLDLRRAISNTAWASLSKNDLNTLYNNNNPSINSLIPSDATLSNIHLGSTSKPLFLPQTDSYKLQDDSAGSFTYQTKQDVSSRTISYATPGVKGFSDFFTDYGKQVVYSSNTNKLPFIYTGQNTVTGRKKTLTRRSTFSPVNSLGYNTRFGSLVYAYTSSSDTYGDRTFYPVIDCLFYDSSGRSLMPHYRFISGIHMTERGSGILDGFVNITGVGEGNIFKFVSRRTFQGPSTGDLTGHALTKVVSWVNGSVNQYSGYLFSGNLNVGISGVTGFTTGSGASGFGYGCIYGVMAPSGFYDTKPDLGLAEHSLNSLVEPSNTGTIYWPIVAKGYELGVQFTGIRYFHPEMDGITVPDETGYFGQRQIVRSVYFEPLTTGHDLLPRGSFNEQVSGLHVNATRFSGYYFTIKQFSGDKLNLSQDVIRTNTFGVTGYLIPKSLTPGKLFGTVWKDAGGLPLTSLAFFPVTTATTIHGTGNNQKVSRLFNSLCERGLYPCVTGNNHPIQLGNQLSLFFTGSSGDNGVYLTYVSGETAPSTNIYGYSYLSGTVNLTEFRFPSGYVQHGENFGTSTGWRLAPNFSAPNYYGSDIPSANQGGEYPALSLDNGLEMFLDITWSSPCGPSTTTSTCNEPV